MTDYGASGDAISLLLSTTTGSATVTAADSHTFTSADIGKVIQVFKAGSNITYQSSTIITQQDLIATVTGVPTSTTLTMSLQAGKDIASAYAILGTNNAASFQAAINAADANTTIQIPAGSYLLLSTQALNPAFVMANIFDGHPAVTVTNGGIKFVGDSAATTVLLGCGAGMNHQVTTMYPANEPPFVPYRGFLFWCVGPVTNSQYPLIFENLTFDGGLTNGLQDYNYWIIDQGSGDGWDTTHGAIVDYSTGSRQMHQLKIFTNCVFQHWRGEILKSTVASGGTNTFIEIADCSFADGNASAINFTFGHHVTNCTFSRLVKVLELYQDHTRLPSRFEHSVWTNIVTSPFTIVGATTNREPPDYVINDNIMSAPTGTYCITFSPARNVTISNNTLYSDGVSMSGVGLQPSDGSAATIANIIIASNSFTGRALRADGYPARDVFVLANTSSYTASFAYMVAGWKTNFVFLGNSSATAYPVNATGVTDGKWPLDDPSNFFANRPINSGGASNNLSYAMGGRYALTSKDANTVLYLDDSLPDLVPSGATMTITNKLSASAPVRTTSNYGVDLATLTNHTARTFYWGNGTWRDSPAWAIATANTVHATTVRIGQ